MPIRFISRSLAVLMLVWAALLFVSATTTGVLSTRAKVASALRPADNAPFPQGTQYLLRTTPGAQAVSNIPMAEANFDYLYPFQSFLPVIWKLH